MKERAKEGVDRLLLAPVYLVYEIVAVLFPGVIFLLLLLVKGNHAVVAALQSPLLGYKTKLCIALLIGYLAGKVFSIPADGLWNYFGKRFVKEAVQPGSRHLPDLAKRFLTGAFFLPRLYASEHALDYLVMALMNFSFGVTTGIVLLISSLIPGDHSLRLVEAVTGVLLLVRGHKGVRSCLEMTISMLGLAHSAMVQKLFPGDKTDAMQAALKVMSLLDKLGQSPTTPSTTPQPPSPPVSDKSA
jgi:hypothetical protein